MLINNIKLRNLKVVFVSDASTEKKLKLKNIPM